MCKTGKKNKCVEEKCFSSEVLQCVKQEKKLKKINFNEFILFY